MSTIENANKFFDACETGKGWDGCKDYVAENASFECQAAPLADVGTVEAYCEWIAGFANVTAPGCRYDLHTSGFDADNNTAFFFATFIGTHSGDGGPVPPTNKETRSHYVYTLTMNAEGKVEKMVKIWNASFALRQLGWM